MLLAHLGGSTVSAMDLKENHGYTQDQKSQRSCPLAVKPRHIHRSYHIHILNLSDLYQANRKRTAIPNILLPHNFAKKLKSMKKNHAIVHIWCLFQTATNLENHFPLLQRAFRI